MKIFEVFVDFLEVNRFALGLGVRERHLNFEKWLMGSFGWATASTSIAFFLLRTCFALFLPRRCFALFLLRRCFALLLVRIYLWLTGFLRHVFFELMIRESRAKLSLVHLKSLEHLLNVFGIKSFLERMGQLELHALPNKARRIHPLHRL